MFNLERTHLLAGLIGAVVSGAVSLVLFGVTYGSMATKVDGLVDRVKQLEEEAKPSARKGDLCLKLMDAQIAAYRNGSGQSDTAELVNQQLEKLGCYTAVPAIQPIGNATKDR